MTAIIAFKYVVGDYNGRKLAEACVAKLMAEGAWRMIVNYRGLRLLMRSTARDVAPIVLPNGRGLISGIIFRRGEGADRRMQELEAPTIDAWCGSDARALTETHWGPYLAILHDAERDRVLIFRDPMGARACYFADLPGVAILFTHVEDWAKVKALDIDDDYLRLFVKHPRIEGARTALAGVGEAIPGMLYCWGREGFAQAPVWTPAPPKRNGLLADFDAARAALRCSAEAAAGAWAHAGLPIVHRLSGGFDSSAALALLAKAGAHDLMCVNERPINLPEGDEFAEASIMAAHVGAKLQGIMFDPAHADYAAVQLAPASAKPSPADMSYASNALGAVLEDLPFCVISSGQGGDQVFSRRPLLDGAADAIRDGVAWRDVRRILWEEAHLSRKPLSRVLAETWLGLTQSQVLRVAALLDVHGEAAAEAASAALDYQIAHPWLRDVDHRGPARAYRALNILDLAYYQRPVSATRYGAAAPILASQPVVETVLRIPPYLMQQGGRERALARAAFADLLPEATLARTRKGDTTRHFQRALANNLAYLRTLLPDGELVRRGILDPNLLLRDLDQPEGRGLFRLTAAYTAEAWIARIKALPAPLPEHPEMNASA